MEIRKTPFRRTAAAALACLLLSFCPGAATGADTSRENCTAERLSHSNIMVLNTNEYTEGRPVIIFFPGGEECGNLGDVMRFIRGYRLYDDVEADMIAVAFRTKALRPKDWEKPAQDLMEYLRERYQKSPFPIIVDAVSFGGYGGCYLTQLFNENGMQVKELNLADACIPHSVTAEWLQELALSGTQVNAWGCYGSTNVSRETREIIEKLDGTERFRGELIRCSHGQVLSMAIHEFGLHAEYTQ